MGGFYPPKRGHFDNSAHDIIVDDLKRAKLNLVKFDSVYKIKQWFTKQKGYVEPVPMVFNGSNGRTFQKQNLAYYVLIEETLQTILDDDKQVLSFMNHMILTDQKLHLNIHRLSMGQTI